jgi:hypothetical protein
MSVQFFNNSGMTLDVDFCSGNGQFSPIDIRNIENLNTESFPNNGNSCKRWRAFIAIPAFLGHLA